MVVVLASDSESLVRSFRPLERSSGIEFIRLNHKKLKPWVRERTRNATQGSQCVVYVDVADLAATEYRRLIRSLLKKVGLLVGICDPVRDIEDPAAWFHEGVVDYVLSPVLADGLKPSRVHSVRGFAEAVEQSCGSDSKQSDGAANTLRAAPTNGTVIPSEVHPQFPNSPPADLELIRVPEDLSNLVSGSEYTLGILHVKLDLAESTIRDASAEFISSSIDAFQDARMEVVGPLGGRLWFWKEYSGVILFPYDGTNCSAVLAGMRIMLRRIFWQAEHKTNFITKHFRMSLHLGNVLYREGVERETLISDLVNYLFHLGEKFTHPGEFVFTADIGHCCPHGLRSCFAFQGRFRGHDIWRMKKLLTPREVMHQACRKWHALAVDIPVAYSSAGGEHALSRRRRGSAVFRGNHQFKETAASL